MKMMITMNKLNVFISTALFIHIEYISSLIFIIMFVFIRHHSEAFKIRIQNLAKLNYNGDRNLY